MSTVSYELLSAAYRQALQQFVAADHELAIRLGVVPHEEARVWILDALKASRERFAVSIPAWWESGEEAFRGLKWNEPRVTSKRQPLERIGVDDPLPQKLELAWGERSSIPLPPLTIDYHDPVLKALKGPGFITVDERQRDILAPEDRWKLHIQWRAVRYINARGLLGGEMYQAAPEDDQPFPVDARVLDAPALSDPVAKARQIATELTRIGASERDQFRLQSYKSVGSSLPNKLVEEVAEQMGCSFTTARTRLEKADFVLPPDLRLALKHPKSGR